jgi:hypothetical protein
MEATITYLLTEQAQRKAMAATGQPVHRKQTMVIDVPGDDLMLFPISDDGTISVDVSGFSCSRWADPLNAAGWSPWNGGTGTTAVAINPPFLADLQRGLAVLTARKEEQRQLTASNDKYNRQMTEAAYLLFFADRDARINTTALRGLREYVGNLHSPADWWPEQHAEFVAEINRRNAADVAAKKAAEQAKEDAKSRYIADWAAHAAANIREQFNDGLLSRSQILELIADEFFSKLKLPEHTPHTCSNRQCPCSDDRVEIVSIEAYAAWREIKANVPEGATVKFSKVTSDDNLLEPYYTADLSLPCGPFTFDRRIQLNLQD